MKSKFSAKTWKKPLHMQFDTIYLTQQQKMLLTLKFIIKILQNEKMQNRVFKELITHYSLILLHNIGNEVFHDQCWSYLTIL